uniref:Uncharacterized protein n=1 Tax=Oryza punctata TaxID=4537 RepID=A0A0E0KNC0_ORYPU
MHNQKNAQPRHRKSHCSLSSTHLKATEPAQAGQAMLGDITILQQHPQQVSSTLGHTTAINSSDAPRIAPIQMSNSKSQIGDTMSKKVLVATTPKKVVIFPWKVNTQSNAFVGIPASKEWKDKLAMSESKESLLEKTIFLWRHAIIFTSGHMLKPPAKT